MKKMTFKPERNESDEEFRNRVEDFADKVATLAIKYMDKNDVATSAEVLYF